MTPSTNTGELLDHLFRRSAGRMTAHLTRLLGSSRLDLAEELLQEAMLRALQTWPYHGVPENAAAWLFRTARNAALDVLRREALATRSLPAIGATSPAFAQPAENSELEEQLRDDELRMIFMCCHPDIPRDSSVALSLKTVGGFSVREIARAFLTEEATIAQRLVRAKRRIRDAAFTLDMPCGDELQRRLSAAMEVLYCIFNEGYAAHEGEDLIRRDLCMEAIRLTGLIAASSIAEPRVHALLAVMALHAARLPARVDALGNLVLLEDQDQSRWDRPLIALGFQHLDQSMAGEEVSEYHVQAAIAATHIQAAGGPVDWPKILMLYDQLWDMSGSPIVALNRAVAVSKVHGPADALAAIDPLLEDPTLSDYHPLLSVRGHFLLQANRPEEAAGCFQAALECRCSEPERRFLARKLAECRSVAPSAFTRAQSAQPHG